MAAIVGVFALDVAKSSAAADTERVRKFILKRRGEILADLTPRAPGWPEPEDLAPPPAVLSGTLEVTFQTIWGSNLSPNPAEEGEVTSLLLNEALESVEGLVVTVGYSSREEGVLLPDSDTASIIVATVQADGSVSGMPLVVALDQLTAGATLVIGADAIAGGIWSIPPGGLAPDSFSPFTEGVLELSSAQTTPGAAIAGNFSGTCGTA